MVDWKILPPYVKLSLLYAAALSLLLLFTLAVLAVAVRADAFVETFPGDYAYNRSNCTNLPISGSNLTLTYADYTGESKLTFPSGEYACVMHSTSNVAFTSRITDTVPGVSFLVNNTGGGADNGVMGLMRWLPPGDAYVLTNESVVGYSCRTLVGTLGEIAFWEDDDFPAFALGIGASTTAPGEGVHADYFCSLPSIKKCSNASDYRQSYVTLGDLVNNASYSCGSKAAAYLSQAVMRPRAIVAVGIAGSAAGGLHVNLTNLSIANFTYFADNLLPNVSLELVPEVVYQNATGACLSSVYLNATDAEGEQLYYAGVPLVTPVSFEDISFTDTSLTCFLGICNSPQDVNQEAIDRITFQPGSCALSQSYNASAHYLTTWPTLPGYQGKALKVNPSCVGSDRRLLVNLTPSGVYGPDVRFFAYMDLNSALVPQSFNVSFLGEDYAEQERWRFNITGSQYSIEILNLSSGNWSKVYNYTTASATLPHFDVELLHQPLPGPTLSVYPGTLWTTSWVFNDTGASDSLSPLDNYENMSRYVAFSAQPGTSLYLMEIIVGGNRISQDWRPFNGSLSQVLTTYNLGSFGASYVVTDASHLNISSMTVSAVGACLPMSESLGGGSIDPETGRPMSPLEEWWPVAFLSRMNPGAHIVDDETKGSMFVIMYAILFVLAWWKLTNFSDLMVAGAISSVGMAVFCLWWGYSAYYLATVSVVFTFCIVPQFLPHWGIHPGQGPGGSGGGRF